MSPRFGWGHVRVFPAQRSVEDRVLTSLFISVLVSSVLTQVVVCMVTIYLHRVVTLFAGGGGFCGNYFGLPHGRKVSFARNQFDPAWSMIWLLTKLKLARPYETIEDSLVPQKRNG